MTLAKPVTLQEFTKFYVAHLQHRSFFWAANSDTTHEFQYIDVGIDSRSNDIWRITLDLKHPTKKLEANSTMEFDGTILELLEHLLDERLARKQSGAI